MKIHEIWHPQISQLGDTPMNNITFDWEGALQQHVMVKMYLAEEYHDEYNTLTLSSLSFKNFGCSIRQSRRGHCVQERFISFIRVPIHWNKFSHSVQIPGSQWKKSWDYFDWYMTSRKSSSFTREGSHVHHSVDFRMELILEEELDNCSSRFLSGT